MAQLFAQNPPGRISQLLPTVKCSNCNAPVPLAELGDHICTKPPPVPALPKPSVSPIQATSLLPPRLQNLVLTTSLDNTHRSISTSPVASSSSSSRLRSRSPSSLSPGRSRDHVPLTGSPLRTHSPQASTETHRSSNASSITPSTARPSISSYRELTATPQSQQRQQSSFPSRSTPSLPPPGPIPRTPLSSSPAPRMPSSPIPGSQGIPRQVEDLDTKIGGEAGMAGVGRRGFAAAARAALFVMPPQTDQDFSSFRRPNAPTFLDINTTPATSNGTPPLSADSGSYSSHSRSPVSPSPLSTVPPRIPSPEILPASPGLSRLPLGKYQSNLPETPSTARAIPPGRKPSNDIPQPQRSMSGKSVDTTASSSAPFRWAGREDRDRDPPLSPTASSESEYGLAYADSTDYEDDDDEPLANGKSKPPPLSLNVSSSILRPDSSTSSQDTNGRIKFSQSPKRHKKSSSSVSSSSSAGRSNSSRIAHALGLSQTPPKGGPGTPSRRSAGGSSVYSKSSAGGGYFNMRDSGDVSPGGGLDRLEGLKKSKSTGKHHHFPSTSSGSQGQGSGPGLGKAQRSNTVHDQRSPPETVSIVRAKTESQRDSQKPGAAPAKKSRIKVCVRCEKRIDDGRWIQVDGGGVLCEKCWKNMYLPKCRRCNLPIERQAVSSSDGQLKGKYHKECFNCFTCNKPFPDKTFYVYDGKPLCAYHYHEANDSLCCAATCGQPIEGPCAVSHNGDRYHPEHFMCEYPGGCRERLEEYWEHEGRMLCERHARVDVDDDDDWEGERAMRRKTRFIDLAALGGSGLR